LLGAISRKASAFACTRGQQVVFRPGIPTLFFAPRSFRLAARHGDRNSGHDVMDHERHELQLLNIEESSATDPLPLFGEPTVSGNELLFKPQEYFSYSEGWPRT